MWRCIHLKDGIIKETKNSRLLKAELPATYAELAALAAGDGIPADVLFHAEGWQQLPTFLNKKNLLQDSTAGLLGLTGDPTVDDAFVALLLTVKQMALVRVTVTVAGSPAIADIEVTGLEDLAGGPVYTDADGAAVGFAPAGEVSISTPTYQDLPAAPAAARELAAGEIVDVSLAIGTAPQAGDKSVTSTTNSIRFSPYVAEVDVCCVGAGGGGAIGVRYGDGYIGGGAGGGGGYVTNSFGIVPDTKEIYEAIVGAAGQGGKNTSMYIAASGTDGGKSSFMGVEAVGGQGGKIYSDSSSGGAGNGPGGSDSENGTDGSVRAFGEPTGDLFGGGGAGTGTGYYDSFSGGAPYGGDSPTQSSDGQSYGQSGKGPGGGGAGSYRGDLQSGNMSAGDGYRGEVRYRWRVA